MHMSVHIYIYNYDTSTQFRNKAKIITSTILNFLPVKQQNEVWNAQSIPTSMR